MGIPMIDATQSEGREVGRFAFLLVALAMFMCGMAFFTSDEGVGPWVLRLGTMLMVLAAVYTASERRWHFVVALVLALPALGTLLHEALVDERGTFLLRASLNATLLFYTALLVSIDLVKQRRVSVDTILGGINVYLLFAIGFMFLHGIVAISNPGSYLYQGEPLRDLLGEMPGIRATGTLLYFSVVTMTTLGYGDIVPVSPVARMLCGGEAMAGQLYVAIFIARLVALQVGQASTQNR
jgi:voltage-gated potassium channel Kch